MSSLRIALTWSEARYENYPRWLQSAGVKVIELSATQPVGVEGCDGLLLSGGVDMHPRCYQQEKTTYANAPRAFNTDRDQFEIEMLRQAISLRMPILGICRGLQLINVTLGGSLIQDIGDKNSTHKRGEADKLHTITTVTDTLLEQISGNSGTVNSAHHQAIDRLGNGLLANAHAPDGVIEGIEWADKVDKPWLLAVQWHPERITDSMDNPFSYKILEAFLHQAKQYAANK